MQNSSFVCFKAFRISICSGSKLNATSNSLMLSFRNPNLCKASPLIKMQCTLSFKFEDTAGINKSMAVEESCIHL